MTNTKENKNEKIETNAIMTYKGKNLVRAGNVFCYGNDEDKYVVLMEVLDQNESSSNKMSVALFDRQELIKNPGVMFLDFCERTGLYDALETAYILLTKER